MVRTLLLAATLAVAVPAFASPFGDTAAVSDAELADMRGGFALPGGLDVALSVRLDTSVDGRLLLRTVFVADQGAPAVAVYAPPPGESGPAIAMRTTGGSTATASRIEVAFDRSNGVTMLRPTGSGLTPTVSIGTGGSVRGDPAPNGWPPLAVTPGGAAVATAGGAVSVEQLAGGLRVALDGPDLDVSHLTGQAFGTLVANTANDRVIDSATTIDIALRGATPELIGSALLRVDAIALDAVRTRGL